MFTSHLNNKVTIPAGFWLRAIAGVIDLLLAFVVYMLVCFSAGALGAMVFGQASVVSWATPVAYGLQFFVPWLYFSIMESSEMQATFGKKALGLKVIDINGNRLSFSRATARFFGKILSALLLGLGFVMTAFTPRKQALHDIIVESTVVKLVDVPVTTTWHRQPAPDTCASPVNSFFN